MNDPKIRHYNFKEGTDGSDNFQGYPSTKPLTYKTQHTINLTDGQNVNKKTLK